MQKEKGLAPLGNHVKHHRVIQSLLLREEKRPVVQLLNFRGSGFDVQREEQGKRDDCSQRQCDGDDRDLFLRHGSFLFSLLLFP